MAGIIGWRDNEVEHREWRSQEVFLKVGGGEVSRQKNKKDVSDELLYSTAQSFMRCAERMRVLQLSRQHGN